MEVQKVGDISYKEFMEQFYNPGIPVVFKNASKVWKANGIFSPEWFKDNFGERTTNVKGHDFTMREVIDLVQSSNESNPAPYPIIFHIPSTLPEILPLLGRDLFSL